LILRGRPPLRPLAAAASPARVADVIRGLVVRRCSSVSVVLTSCEYHSANELALLSSLAYGKRAEQGEASD
jgi:hypothetical protein